MISVFSFLNSLNNSNPQTLPECQVYMYNRSFLYLENLWRKKTISSIWFTYSITSNFVSWRQKEHIVSFLWILLCRLQFWIMAWTSGEC